MNRWLMRIHWHLLFACFTASALGQTISVPTPAQSIQAAIASAGPGTTITLGAGVWNENLDLLGKAVEIEGQGQGVTIIDGQFLGPVVTVNSGEQGALIKSLTIRNGRGGPQSFGTSISSLFGGGVSVYGSQFFSPTPVSQVTLEDCELTSNFAQVGYVASCHSSGGLTMKNCHIHSNLTTDPLGLVSTLAGSPSAVASSMSHLLIEECRFENNSGAGVAHNGFFAGAFRDCVFRNNAGYGLSLAGNVPHEITRCQFINNSAAYGAAMSFGGTGVGNVITVRDCLIAGNTASVGGGAVQIAGGELWFDGCTIVNNSAPTGGFYMSPSNSFQVLTVTNSIVRDNGVSPVVLPASPGFGSLTINHSNWEGTVPGTGNIDLDPLFVDALNGDFHLQCNSPCINAGAPSISAGAGARLDLDGDLRPLGGRQDMGSDEVDSIGFSSSMGGTIVDGQGEQEDVLRVNGETGGETRCIVLDLNESFDFAVSAPSQGSTAPQFAVFGVLGVPDAGAATTVPGVGLMAFAPCPLVPFWSDFFFTLTNNVSPLPCGQLLPSSPAPWVSPVIPALGQPVSFTVQGVVQTSPGTFGVTNGIVVEVR
jgi:parallel beta helix pectate lyase-like protein